MSRVVIERGVLIPLDKAKVVARFRCRTPERMAFVAYGKDSASCGGCAAYCGGPRSLFRAPEPVLTQAVML